MTATPVAIQKMLDWQKANAGRIRYSQSDPHRLSSDSAHMLSPTDCSGLIARLMKHFAGIDVGTYTGNECSHGHLVTVSKSAARSGYGMLPGDCILFEWAYENSGTWDHIAMYAGGGRIWNNGGDPLYGPVNWSLAQSVNNAKKIMVRRFVAWPSGTVTHPPVHPKPGHPSPNPLHGHAIPALIARGTGDYYGLITGPNASHGGAYASERPAIELIKKFLNWKMGSKLKVDGKFGQTTKAAVTAYQKKYEPRTEFFGQVWYDDWAKMAGM